jgi:hypothetical protein
VDQASNASNVLFDVTAQQISLGMVKVSGTLVVRFISNALKVKFLAGTSTDLSFTLGGSAKAYTFDMSKVYLTSGTNSTEETELTQTFNFSAIYDSGDASALMITRDPS